VLAAALLQPLQGHPLAAHEFVHQLDHVLGRRAQRERGVHVVGGGDGGDAFVLALELTRLLDQGEQSVRVHGRTFRTQHSPPAPIPFCDLPMGVTWHV